MYKQLAIPILLLFWGTTVTAQGNLNDNQWNTISFAGDYFNTETSGFELAWVAGEPVVSTLSNNDLQVSQGYLQSAHLLTTSAEELSFFADIKVFPNPSAGFITVASDGLQAMTGRLSDALGRQVLHFQNISAAEQIDLSRLPTGTYFLQLFNQQQGFQKTFKIQKH
jgi:hypothetical protein